MKKIKDKRWFENKSNYSVGLGLGVLLSALAFSPANGVSAARNIWWGIFGVIIMVIGGVYGSIAKKKDK